MKNNQTLIRIKLAEKLCTNLKNRLGENLISFLIFGSTARGTPKEESDIDILLLVKDEKIARIAYLEEKLRIEKSRPPFFSAVITTEDDLKENPYILIDITQEHIMLHDPHQVAKNLLKKLSRELKKLKAKRIWVDKDKWYWDLKPDWRPGEVVEIKLSS